MFKALYLSKDGDAFQARVADVEVLPGARGLRHAEDGGCVEQDDALNLGFCADVEPGVRAELHE